jgi:hypothetical protein
VWAKRVPAPHGEKAEGKMELCKAFEMEDFSPSDAVDRPRKLGNDLAKNRK